MKFKIEKAKPSLITSTCHHHFHFPSKSPKDKQTTAACKHATINCTAGRTVRPTTELLPRRDPPI